MGFNDTFTLPITITTQEQYRNWKLLWIKHHDTSNWSDEYAARVEAALEEYNRNAMATIVIHTVIVNLASETLCYKNIEFKTIEKSKAFEAYSNTIFNEDYSGVVLYVPSDNLEFIHVSDIVSFCDNLIDVLFSFGDISSGEYKLIFTIKNIISNPKYPHRAIPPGVSDFNI